MMSKLSNEQNSSDMKRLFLVRDATAEDATAISELLGYAFREFEAIYTPDAYQATVLTQRGVLARIEEGPVWVAEKESAIIGTAGIVCLDDTVLIRGMAVHPAKRGLGIARSLLDKAECAARTDRYPQLALYTTSFLVQAIRLYQASGFCFTGNDIYLHGMRLLHMVKNLEDDSGR